MRARIGNDVVFAGTEKEKLGSMSGGYFVSLEAVTIIYYTIY